MKIKSDGYFGKNIAFTCEHCNCVYEVESREDWEERFRVKLEDL